MIARSLIAAALVLVSACTAHDDKDNVTASIDINGNGMNGSAVAITGDSDTGKMSLKVPGFEAKLSLPAGIMNKSSFDIDGVKLYPGSKVTNINVESGNGDKGQVRVGFESPAAPAVVKSWFTKAFADNGMTVAQSDSGLSGTDKDGSPFAIAFRAKGSDATVGQIMMRDND